MHDAYTIGIPVLVILIANLIGRSDLKDLKSALDARLDKMQAESNTKFDKIDARFDRIDKRFDLIDAELPYFHGITGKLDGRISAIEKH